MHDHPEHRTLIALDIGGFGDRERTNLVRRQQRQQLRSGLAKSLTEIGVVAERYQDLDTVGGWLLSIDPHVHRDVLLAGFPVSLRQDLAQYNHDRPELERLRVRMAVHAGDVLPDPGPFQGDATIRLFRLLHSEVARGCLRATHEPLAVIVSSLIHELIVRHGYAGIDPAAWHRVVAQTKEGAEVAWVHVPDDPEAPWRAEAWPAGRTLTSVPT